MISYDFKFELGDLLREKVTGFEGVVMAVSYYFTGCNHYGLVSRNLKDGVPVDWQWFDESRLILTEKSVVKYKDEDEKSTSGPMPNAPQIG